VKSELVVPPRRSPPCVAICPDWRDKSLSLQATETRLVRGPECWSCDEGPACQRDTRTWERLRHLGPAWELREAVISSRHLFRRGQSPAIMRWVAPCPPLVGVGARQFWHLPPIVRPCSKTDGVWMRICICFFMRISELIAWKWHLASTILDLSEAVLHGVADVADRKL